MRLLAWKVWWHVRMALVLLCRDVLGSDVRVAIVDLAFEAAGRGEHGLFRAAIGRIPDLPDWDAWTVSFAALCYYDTGDVLEAGVLIRKAIADKPDDPLVLRRYARYLRNEGEVQAAAACLEQCHQLQPDDPTTLNWLGNVNLDLGELGKARTCYEKSVSLAPAWGESYTGLANIAAREENWPEAARCWREAISRLAPGGHLWCGLGNALYAMGSHEEARAAYARSVSLGGFGDVGYACGRLALCYHKLGDDRRARKYCRRALKYAPDDEDVLQVKRELEPNGRDAAAPGG